MSSSETVLAARRIPPIFANNLWILLTCVAIAIVSYLTYRKSQRRKEAHQAEVFRGIDGLLAQPRYKAAMARMDEDSFEAAVQHLEAEGVPSAEARANLMKIFVVLRHPKSEA